MENRRNAASHMLALAHSEPPRAPREKHPTKTKKKNIKQQQRENKLVFLFLLCNMVWLDEEEERCVRVFPE